MWALRRNHGSCQPRWAVSPFLTGNGDATRTQPSTLKTNAQRQSVNRVSIVLMLRLHRVERIIRAIRTIPNEAYEANPIWPFVFKNAQARKSRAIHDLFPNQHRVGRAPAPVHRPQVGRGPGQTTNPIFPFVFNKSESGKPISNRGGSPGDSLLGATKCNGMQHEIVKWLVVAGAVGLSLRWRQPRLQQPFTT